MALVVATCCACSRPDIEFIDPWIPAAPPDVSVFAGYFEVRNNTSEPIVLISAGTPHFDAVELHRTVEENGLARMVRQDAVEVSSNATYRFAPGGYHLMLINPIEPVSEGANIPLKMSFEDGRAVVVDFTVRRMALEL